MTTLFSHEFNFNDYFLKSSSFLVLYSWAFEHPNTKFIQTGVLDRIPQSWVEDLRHATVEEFNRIPLGYLNENWSNEFRTFLQTLRNLLVSFEQIDHKTDKLSGWKGVNPKKLYEIENLTAVISQTCNQDEILLDFGSGLGYLSQNLHLKHNFKVLGIEQDSYRVKTSERRQSKMMSNSQNCVKFIQHSIDENSFEFVKATASSSFPQEYPLQFAIVGLHACADLSITAIKMFLENEAITKLVIMPCCYHKLKPRNENCTGFFNFPVSGALRKVLSNLTNFISRPFLRLACQQTAARWQGMTQEEHLSHGKTMFERSLVEAVLDEQEFVTMNKNNLNSNRNGAEVLENYLLYCKTDPSNVQPWKKEHLSKIELFSTKYPSGSQLAEYLTCIQTCLQPICENLILLDRLCYIETEATNRGLKVARRIIKFANDQLSPRCFVIIAEKYPSINI